MNEFKNFLKKCLFKLSKNCGKYEIQIKIFNRLAQLHGIVGIKVEVGTSYFLHLTLQKRGVIVFGFFENIYISKISSFLLLQDIVKIPMDEFNDLLSRYLFQFQTSEG